jgi:hypothetical protein
LMEEIQSKCLQQHFVRFQKKKNSICFKNAFERFSLFLSCAHNMQRID